MAGVTLLAFGNGSPDVFSTFAAMNSHSGSLAVGELIGAAGFITAVVAGSMALVREFKVGKKTFVRDVGFFIVAASFTMMILADGALHLWECCVMIGFYIFYVVLVVLWHWYLSRRRRRREREAAARGQYLAMTNEELEVAEEDRGDEEPPTGGRRYRDSEDSGALERGSSPAYVPTGEDESDEDRDEGVHLATEMATSMRVAKPKASRRNTITPIRPSLVGALEFRSVLSSLQRSRGSSNVRPIHLRRYSDDPTAAGSQYYGPGYEGEPYSDNASSVIVTSTTDSQAGLSTAGASARARAVSMNDVDSRKPLNHDTFNGAEVPDIDLIAPTPKYPQHLDVPGDGPGPRATTPTGPAPLSPTLSVTPPPSTGGTSRDSSPMPSHRRSRESTLAPPVTGFPGARHLRVDFSGEHGKTMVESPEQSPRTVLRPKAKPRPTLQIPTSSSRDSSRSPIISPIIQFPAYTDSPLPLSSRSSKPPSIVLPDSTLPVPHDSLYSGHPPEYQESPGTWSNYCFVPNPQILASTLFPTLCTWRDKSIWDKFVSVISAPSIFLLAITLPVVESESQDEGEKEEAVEASLTRPRSGTAPLLIPDTPSLEREEPEWIRYRHSTLSQEHPPLSPSQLRDFSMHSTAAVAVSTENLHHHPHPIPVLKRNSIDHSESHPSEPTAGPPRDWNPWLVAVQIFTAPLFVVLIVWANTEQDPRFLVKLVFYSLLGSLMAFALLLFTTTPSKPPKYRFLLCFVGFVVSISWISTIANEVVGVLKAFGVILGISDAILGLTIFAVGNSLGDLVADITVARLGYPVMALSACFGGPMLNILLGIGVSGLYMTIKEANQTHAKHPGKAIKYKPYEIKVSGTLLVSAITLLVTLVGLLIAVPLNKWIMSRRIGWGLIMLWSIGTIINLAVEVSGVWGEAALLL